MNEMRLCRTRCFVVLSIFFSKYLVGSSKYIRFYFDRNMSFRLTRSSGENSVRIVDRLMGNLACGYALDDQMATCFDMHFDDLQQLLLINVSWTFLLGNTSGMNMSETRLSSLQH